MKRYFEELKDFHKKGDMVLLVLCLIVAGFGLVCMASATSAPKFEGNFRYIAVQVAAISLALSLTPWYPRWTLNFCRNTGD